VRRDTILRTRLYPAELAEVERRAAAAGLDVSAWVRAQILGAEVAPDGRTREARSAALQRLDDLARTHSAPDDEDVEIISRGLEDLARHAEVLDGILERAHSDR
jgi:hypothetical protein